jgi:hypothetical protein
MDNKPHNILLFHHNDDVMQKIYSIKKNEITMRCRNCLISLKNSWSFLLGFMFLFLWAGFSASAQTITIDGNPIDWSDPLVRSNPTYTHVIDDWGKGTDNQFTQGSKDFMLAADQRWSVGQTSNKTDIANAAVVMIGCKLYFAGDRLSTNGDANIGFWFYLNGTAPQINPVTGAYDFAPEHVVGDILVIADFSKGGTVSKITVYKWVGTGGAFGGGTLDLVSDVLANVAQNNVNSHPVPDGWLYITPDYPTNSFYEGMIDLCGLQLDNYCFSSFLLETRNSDALNAMLGDFVAGDFGAKPKITAIGGSICEPGGSVELCAVSANTSLTYQWYTNADLTTMVPNGDTKCISVNVTSTTNYWVVATNDLNCTSDAVMVTATVYPSVACSIAGSLEVCPNGEFTYMGPADMLSYSWTILGNATIVGATNARMVIIKTGENCEDFTLSLNSVSAGNCISNCLITVNVNDVLKPVAANCPSVPFIDLGCNPEASKYAPSLVPGWSDNCGIKESGVRPGTPVADANGCGMTVTHVYYALDWCGNEQTCSQVFKWKIDVLAPVVVDIPDYQLAACNAPWPAMLTTTWTDNCGIGGLTSGSLNSDAGVNVIVNGCVQTRLYTFTATDDCGNTATQTVTVSRKYDVLAPVVVDIPDYQLAACNAPWPAMLTTTWTDNCGVGGQTSGSLNSDAGVNVIVDACIQTRLYTFTATDDCGNTATQTVTVSRRSDLLAPVIVDIADYQLAACNAPWPAYLTTTWTDNCGIGGLTSGSLMSDAGVNVIVDACIQTRLYTFTATDDCGNTASQTVTVSRKYDVLAPVVVDIPDYQLAACNAPWPAMLTTTWTDNCGVGGQTSGSLNSDAGVNVIVNACIQTRLYTFTATDDCGNIATQTVTVSRRYDVTPPVINAPADYTVCMVPLPLTLTATWTDNCSAGGNLTATGVLFSQTECTTTFAYTFTATDDCGNTATKTVYVTRETEVYENCETMFARYDINSRCFLEDGFNRWGWTNKFSPRAEPYTLTLYAGAAQCDVAKGTEVGKVIITYFGGNLKVEYVMYQGYTMSEAHVYVGCEPYPKLGNNQTVAPGQYTFNKSSLGNLSGMTVNFTNVTGDIYIIVHGVSCEEKCSCTVSNNSNGGVKIFDSVNLKLNCASPSATVESGSKGKQASVIITGQLIETGLNVYPNPFNNFVNFEFVSSRNATARLEIFDMLGQRITTLMDHPVEKDVLNKVEFKPENLVPGILLYRLTLGEEIINGKLIYNK